MNRSATQLLDWHGVGLVFGLDWVYSQRPMTAAEIRQRGLAQRSQRYVVHPAPDADPHSVTGFVRLPRGVKPAAKLVAFASALARMRSDSAAYVFRITDAQWSLVVALQGRPAPGLDLVGPPEAILRELARQLDLHGLQTVCAEPGLHGVEQALPEGIQLHLLELPVVPQAWDSGTLQALPPMPAAQRTLIVAIPAVLALVGGWQWHEKAQAARDEEQARLTSNPVTQRAARVRTALQARPLVPVDTVVSEVLGTVARTPLDVRGWSLKEVHCKVVPGGTGSCELQWTREGTATFLDFRTNFPIDDADITLSSDLRGLTTRARLQPMAATVNTSQVQSFPQFMAIVGSQFQLLREFGLDASLSTPVPLGSEGGAGSQFSEAGDRSLKVGGWTLVGPLDRLTQVLGLWPASFSATSVSLSFPATGGLLLGGAGGGAVPTIRIAGDFYVQ